MDSNLIIGGLGAVLLLGIVKFVFGGGNGNADEAAEKMGEVAQAIRRRLTGWKKKNAKKKHDDASDSSLDEWLDDKLGPKP